MRWAPVFLSVGLLLCAGITRADDAHDRARDAYDLGVAAHHRGDFVRAAHEFARADELAPSAVALESALESVLLADDALLGAELVDRASRRAESDAIAKLVAQARAKFSGRTGRVHAECPSAPSCRIEIDGRPLVVAVQRVLVGPHTIVFRRGASADTVTIDVGPEATVDVAPPVEPPKVDRPAHEPVASPRGLSPVWFVAGAVITAGLGVASALSWSDALRKHDRFDASGCDRTPVDGCAAASRDGIAAERRTTALVASTAVVGAATAALGLFFVRWGSGPAISVGRDSLAVAWRTP